MPETKPVIRAQRFVSALLIVLLCVQASALPVLGQDRPTDLRIIIVEAGTNPEPERLLQVQVQDVSRGPLTGVAVVFTLPNTGNAGTFSDGSKVFRVTTDRQGVATARFRPGNLTSRFDIRVEAAFQGQTAQALINYGAPEKIGGGRGKWFLLLGIGAAVAIGVALAGGGNSNAGPVAPSVITLRPQTPTISAPQ